MEDRFAGIREFVATVDGGSFTNAAVELGVTGSAVGKSISKLEARLVHNCCTALPVASASLAGARHIWPGTIA
jgi:hypothetical protein